MLQEKDKMISDSEGEKKSAKNMLKWTFTHAMLLLIQLDFTVFCLNSKIWVAIQLIKTSYRT